MMTVAQEIAQMVDGLNKIAKDANAVESIGDVFFSDVNNIVRYCSHLLGESITILFERTGLNISDYSQNSVDAEELLRVFPTTIPRSLRHTMGIDRAMGYYKIKESDEPKAILSFGVLELFKKLLLSIENKTKVGDLNHEIQQYLLFLNATIEKWIDDTSRSKAVKPSESRISNETMDFNAFTLSEQVDFLVTNTSNFNNESYRMALLCIASKMGEMSENHIEVYWAHLKGSPTNRIFEHSGHRLFYLFVSKDSFMKIPEEKREMFELVKTDISIIIEECIKDSTVFGIAIDPFVNMTGFFYANRDVVTLAW